MAKRAKMTAGERIQLDALREALSHRPIDIQEFRTRPAFDGCRKSARRIDAAIRRAENRAAWDGFGYGQLIPYRTGDDSHEINVENKYGPRPKQKSRRDSDEMDE